MVMHVPFRDEFHRALGAGVGADVIMDHRVDPQVLFFGKALATVGKSALKWLSTIVDV